jgi:hypothetical protein
MVLSREKQEEDDFDTLKVEKQNSTLETTNQPFVSRTYDESPYARRQWEYWVREQRLKRMDEFESVVYGGNREFEVLEESMNELQKNKSKMEFDEYVKQDLAIQKEWIKWDMVLCTLNACKRRCELISAKNTIQKRDFNKDNWYYQEDESILTLTTWAFYLKNLGVSAYELMRFMASVYKEWAETRKVLENNWLLDRKLSLELQKELRELELPRLVSKRNKGLKWPLKDEQTDMFNQVAEKSLSVKIWKTSVEDSCDDKPLKYVERVFKHKKMVTPMHPYVENKLKDSLEVGDYMRVSTNQHIKHKWFTELTPREEWELGCVDGFDDDYVKNCAFFWAKHVRNNHPKYRDPQTRQEKNAKKIEAIKKAYPDYL